MRSSRKFTPRQISPQQQGPKMKDLAKDATPCRLLGLPRELRDMIYTFAVRRTQFRLTFSSTYPQLYCPCEVSRNLLLCNEQIYDECIDIAYKTNTFSLQVDDRDDIGQIVGRYPFWSRIRHMNVHCSTRRKGMLIELVDLIIFRGSSSRP